MKDKTKSILIGISFILAIFLFVWGFNFLKGKSILRNQLNFYAVYNNSKGLLPGDLVTINGMQVGTVSSLDFHPKQDGTIVVAFTMNNDLNIPQNSIVKLASSLTGSVSLEIHLGESDIFAQSGDTLTSAYDNGTMGMIVETIMPIKNSLENLLASLNQLTSNLNSILSPEFKNNIDNTLVSLNASMDNINNITSDLQKFTNEENGKLGAVVNNLEDITNDFAIVSDSLKNIDYNRFILSLENCVHEFNTLANGINSGKGSVGLLMKEDSLYNNLNSTIQSLQLLIDEIKANPKKLKISVF